MVHLAAQILESLLCEECRHQALDQTDTIFHNTLFPSLSILSCSLTKYPQISRNVNVIVKFSIVSWPPKDDSLCFDDLLTFLKHQAQISAYEQNPYMVYF